MGQDIVLQDIKDGVAFITLNRPEVHNAFDEHVIARLSAAWDEMAARDDVKAVVLRGSGKSFCAGGDLNWMKRAAEYSEAQNFDDARGLATMLHKLYMLPQVTIACVQGAAMGGGMGLACCCDIVLAAQDAKFALSEVKLGMIPATIGPYVLRALGERQAKRYFQSGERIDAVRAREIGLAHEVSENIDETLAGILKDIHANGPQAMRTAKRFCLENTDVQITSGIIDATALLIASTRAGKEAKEGVSAFLEKRKAKWTT